MALQEVDYILIIAVILLIVFGLIRGLSGAFAAIVGTVVVAFFSQRCWPIIDSSFNSTPVSVAVLVGSAILVFGLARIVVRKVVNGLLDQPMDSIAGLVISLISALLLLCFIARFPEAREHSCILTKIWGTTSEAASTL